MTTDIAAQPVRLRTPADIVDAVPHLVGFQPEDSVVVISLRGKRSRVGVVARLDLPEPGRARDFAAETVGYLKRDGALRAILVFYPRSDGPAHPCVRPTAEALTAGLAEAGIEFADALCVGDGRWWSLCCDDASCCAPEGTPIELRRASAIAAAAALHGRATLASRGELARTIEPVGGLASAAMNYALPRMRAHLNDRVAAGRRGEVATESLELFRAAVGSRLSGGRAGTAVLSVDEAARLIVGLDDVRVRDSIISWFDGDRGAATRSLFDELVPRAVPPFDVVPLTVLAWISYLQGEGAIAGIAVDRILDAGSADGMVHLLDQALRAGLNPATLRPSMKKLRKVLQAG